MKGKTYYHTSTAPGVVEPISRRRKIKRPWLESEKKPIYFMWHTSIPQKWTAISDRPFLQVRGKESKKRDTLEFLKETQRYINFIRNRHTFGEKESPSSRSASPQVRTKPASRLLATARTKPDTERRQVSPLSVPQVFSRRVSHHETIPPFEVRESTPKKIERVLTLPASLVEPGYGEDLELGGMEEYVVNNYMHPRSLNPVSRRPPKPKNPHPLQAQTVGEFLSRFDKKSEPAAAQPANKRFSGWKLTLGNKTPRAKTSMLSSRSQAKLRQTLFSSESRNDFRGSPVSLNTS